MNKNMPLSMIIKETKVKLANVCNESGLPPVMLDLIMQGIYTEIHSIAERQMMEEEASYKKSVEDTVKDASNKDIADVME